MVPTARSTAGTRRSLPATARTPLPAIVPQAGAWRAGDGFGGLVTAPGSGSCATEASTNATA